MAKDEKLRRGEGFVEQRTRADGSVRYVARWYEGTKLRAKSFPTEKQANTCLVEISHQKRSGTFVPDSDLTVEDVINEYMSRPARSWSDNTRVTYEVYRDRLIFPHLRTRRVADLTPHMIQGWADDLTREGKSSAGIRTALTVLSGALKEAVRLGVVPRNVATGIMVRSSGRHAYVTWSEDEVKTVLATVRDDPFRYAMYALLVSTGIRPGELRALMWDCVDLAKSIVLIRRTITRDRAGNQMVGTTTKTRRNRQIVIPPETTAALRQWRSIQLARQLAHPAWIDQGIVFDRGNGVFLPLEGVRTIHKATIAESGVPEIPLHGVRHTYATLAFAVNTNPKVVSEIMGHASVAFTLDRYTHMTVADQQRSADSISERFFKAKITSKSS